MKIVLIKNNKANDFIYIIIYNCWINLQMYIFLLFVISLINAQKYFQLHKHIEDSAAKCLDGSSSGFYYQEGIQKDKFLIYFQGGGLCRGDGLADMIQYCYKRSFTDLGSSQNYSQQMSFETVSFLSSNSQLNPYATWNRFFIPYCDGSLHMGSKKDPVSYKERNLFFRGSNNTEAHFRIINEKFNLYSANKIIITGTSAGGVASFIWSNYVYERAINKNGILIMPDSGTMILDFPNIYNNKTIVDYTIQTYKLVLQETKIPLDQCIKQYPSMIQCFQSGIVTQYIKPKVFVLQSQYDQWGLTQILQFKCVPNRSPSNMSSCNDTQRAYIQKYRQKINQGMKNITKYQKNGIWSISCIQHGFLQDMSNINSEKYKIPYETGFTINQAVAQYINGRQRLFIDPVDWPNNIGCNGLSRKLKFHLRSA